MTAPEPRPLDRRKIGELAIRYMAKSMAMDSPLEDQAQNQTLRHLTQFAAVIARQIRFEEREWRLAEFDRKEPQP